MATKVDSNITIPLVEYTAANAGTLKGRPKFNLHAVQKGESLQGIATQHGIPYQQLLEANLSYNLATLKKRNPDLTERLSHFVAYNGQGIQQIAVSLEPGQTILVPVTWRSKNARHGNETVYGLNVAPEKVDEYSSARSDPETLGGLLSGLRQENVRNDELAREEQEHVRVAFGLQEARQSHGESLPEIWRKQCDVDKDGPDFSCLAFNTSITRYQNWVEDYLKNSGASHDSDGDGWFSPVEYGALLLALKAQIPHRTFNPDE